MVKKHKKRTAVLIVAGGNGERFGGCIPKQYAKVAGVPILRRVAEMFLSHTAIDEVRIVIRRQDQALYQETMRSLKLSSPVYGGVTRQQSVYYGLRSFAKNPPQYILIHDAARPFVSHALINRVVKKLKNKEDAVIPVVPFSDTVKEVSGVKVRCTLPRDHLALVQTPQGFDFDVIWTAHKAVRGKNFTDDAAVLETAGIPVAVVEGDPRNIKITRKGDIVMEREARVGMGFDVHRFQKSEVRSQKPSNHIKLCGIKVPYYYKLEGHSDADVGLHALVDAMLGAIGAGDIGLHFLPSDPKWKGADSALFVKRAKELLEGKSAILRNVDITIICERPKITPYRTAMQRCVAELLCLTQDRVNIKATTTEGLGFTGRGEGIAAQAVVSVVLDQP